MTGQKREKEKNQAAGFFDGEKKLRFASSLYFLFTFTDPHLFGEEGTEGVAAEGGSCGWGHGEEEQQQRSDVFDFSLSKSAAVGGEESDSAVA